MVNYIKVTLFEARPRNTLAEEAAQKRRVAEECFFFENSSAVEAVAASKKADKWLEERNTIKNGVWLKYLYYPCSHVAIPHLADSAVY